MLYNLSNTIDLSNCLNRSIEKSVLLTELTASPWLSHKLWRVLRQTCKREAVNWAHLYLKQKWHGNSWSAKLIWFCIIGCTNLSRNCWICGFFSLMSNFDPHQELETELGKLSKFGEIVSHIYPFMVCDEEKMKYF